MRLNKQNLKENPYLSKPISLIDLSLNYVLVKLCFQYIFPKKAHFSISFFGINQSKLFLYNFFSF